MNLARKRAAAAAAFLPLLLALGACGDRVENTEMPLAGQPSVEINRQGMEGAKKDGAGVGVVHQGEERRSERRWPWQS